MPETSYRGFDNLVAIVLLSHVGKHRKYTSFATAPVGLPCYGFYLGTLSRGGRYDGTPACASQAPWLARVRVLRP